MHRPRPRGMTLVELLVGLAIGLVLIALAIALLVWQLREHRALLLQSRLMQDLRVATEVVTRDLRRAGYRGEALDGPNPFAALAPASAPSDAVSFRYARDSSDEPLGFRLHDGVIEMLLGGRWQALTDPATLVVTLFQVVPSVHEIDLQGLCARACPSAAPPCAPRQLVRSLEVTIGGHPPTERHMVRSVQSHVRLRNDAIVGRCPA